MTKRHTCRKCGAKRSEKYMKQSGEQYAVRNGKAWVCDDEYCGSAWENQYAQGSRSS